MTLPAIDAVEVLEVRVPRTRSRSITTSYATLPDAHHALVLVRADEHVGLGEAPAERWWTGEDAASVRNAIERYLAPPLLGQAIGIREAARRMDAALAANRYAKAAIEMALWDLLGKVAGLPLYGLLGGGPPLPVPGKYVIGLIDAAAAAALVPDGHAAGFRHFKVKVGGDLQGDLERVAAVQGALRPGEPVGVDANGGWSPPVARTALRELAALGVAWIEQPVDRGLPEAMRRLTAESSVPIVAHESVFTLRDAAEAARLHLADVWAVTPSTHGGVLPTLDMLALARAHGIPCLIGSTVELGIATALMAHVGAATPEIAGCPVPSDVIGPLYHDADIVTGGVQIADGVTTVGDGPGLGVRLDEEAVERFGVRTA